MSLDRSKICHQLKVLKKIQETSDTVSLVLDVPRTPGAKFNYRAGQFVTFFMDIDGGEVRRSYSLASAPEIDGQFKVTIKLVPGGKGSTYLVNKVQEGDLLWTTPPAGHFCLPTDFQDMNLGFFAAGSGITPIISIIKSSLSNEKIPKCFLFYQNRTEDNVIFKSELDQLCAKYPNRLKVQYCFTQPSTNWLGPKGRVASGIIQEFLRQNNVSLETRFYLCGPEGFMATVDKTLRDLNYSGQNIVKESFAEGLNTSAAASSTAPAATASASTAATASPSDSAEVSTQETQSSGQESNNLTIDKSAILIGDQNALAKPNKIEATIDGETHTVEYKKDESILDCLLSAGLNPPYSCLDGACMACIAKVKSGLVYQKDMGILTEDNVEAHECLTCQAKPASKNVVVQFESF